MSAYLQQLDIPIWNNQMNNQNILLEIPTLPVLFCTALN